MVYGYPSATEFGPAFEPAPGLGDPAEPGENERLGAFLFMRSVARAEAGTDETPAGERGERERAEPVGDADEGDPSDLEEDQGGASAKGVGTRGLPLRGLPLRGLKGPNSANCFPLLSAGDFRAELARLPKVLGVAGRRGAPSGAGGNPSSTRNANGVSGLERPSGFTKRERRGDDAETTSRFGDARGFASSD